MKTVPQPFGQSSFELSIPPGDGSAIKISPFVVDQCCAGIGSVQPVEVVNYGFMSGTADLVDSSAASRAISSPSLAGGAVQVSIDVLDDSTEWGEAVQTS